MHEYIEREMALTALCGDCCAKDCDKENNPCNDYHNLKHIPAADVAPVRHGKWERDDYWRCSACEIKFLYPRANYYSYCPYCGAEMDVPDTDVGKEGR